MNQLDKIISITNSRGGKIMFDTAVVCKDSPHHEPFRCWGVWVNGADVWLMDAEEHWYLLEKTDENFRLVVASVYQRLKAIEVFCHG